MPPFSGKKKKEQLQAKRQRKRDEEERSKVRDREREKLREELMERGEDASEAVLDSLLRERANLQHSARGRRSRRREKENAAAHRKAVGGDDEDDESGSGASSDGSNREGGGKLRRSAPSTMMYSADRQHGVRSIFVKESAAVIAARKQLSYQPIPCRTTMPPTGIPFGEWFTFPSSASSAAAVVSAGTNSKRGGAWDGGDGAPMCAEEKLALIAAEQRRRMERPLVASAGDALGGVSSSTFFPFAVELPSRGWHVGAEGSAVVADASIIMAGAGDASTQLQSGRPRAADPQAAGGDSATPASEDGQEEVACAGQRSSSHNEASGADSNDVGASAVRTGAAAAKGHNQGDAQYIRSIEKKRFSLYTDCVDAYPFPAALVGMEVSSYERNVEVWQQLWRTVELSDILVVVADARYPIIHAHLGLLTYITKEQRKPCVFVLNKEDLVPASTLRRWQRFLFHYLDDLGFSVEPPDAAEQPEEKDTEWCNSDGIGQGGSASGRIVLRTFTANPRPETAGQRDGDVDVTRRQKNRKKANEHMYEKLRTGRLSVAKHLGGDQRGAADGNDDDESEEDDELRYDTTEMFVGMMAAQHALQQDRRAYKELEVVAGKITELLATCRRLGTAARATAHGVNTAAVERSDAAPSSSPAYATSSLPCAALRAAHKHKKAQKRNAARRGGGGGGGGGMGGTLAGDDSGSANSDDAVEDRAPDSPSYLHIGFVGHPNVGKSSLLNCIRGTKVVSVSATPGHTKHMQTIPVPSEHLTLVDSPGLALPLFGVPRPLLAVLGTHQIAQTRDPQTSISYLAAYLPIEKAYGLQRPEHALPEVGWSSYELCEAYAKKRGLFVKHGKGALDVHRAAIALLQEAYEGRLALFYAPPELNLLQSAWYRERIRPHLLLSVFKPVFLAST
ncbi:GTP-binding protein-like protein [Leishmania infantum JPCM5]|uniref:Guanine nucleotide-binding protein-like 1 n=2 Tax=Leishmania infantum TaxID=5671 RepID=A0A6L0XFU3_LEIIN|nr:GTP-binding protein-like protein [Leishmania infantum JPCM5]CAC9496778.1 guanine_nucleotide-binding_protein-like_protein [Leishmania infantum]CAM68853.1 GTP-binding protein-like protein [Leishmania infantum JPCM5]SUZ42727.1 guanine_nucleotide-binding_protein-like_protein [Leishmania infantum]|eukprot:XP_001470477.1 GTP-binding protein-like protein [Leishmania infantum JPCM5]